MPATPPMLSPPRFRLFNFAGCSRHSRRLRAFTPGLIGDSRFIWGVSPQTPRVFYHREPSCFLSPRAVLFLITASPPCVLSPQTRRPLLPRAQPVPSDSVSARTEQSITPRIPRGRGK